MRDNLNKNFLRDIVENNAVINEVKKVYLEFELIWESFRFL